MLAETFRKVWEAGDMERLSELYAPNALFDMTLPQWRFQLQGPEAIIAQLKGYFDRGTIEVVDWKAREGEFGVVIEEATRWMVEPEELYYRQVHILVTDANGKIAEHVIYCPGEWDQATVARHKAEAALIRP